MPDFQVGDKVAHLCPNTARGPGTGPHVIERVHKGLDCVKLEGEWVAARDVRPWTAEDAQVREKEDIAYELWDLLRRPMNLSLDELRAIREVLADRLEAKVDRDLTDKVHRG